jgi:hypothetical protein
MSTLPVRWRVFADDALRTIEINIQASQTFHDGGLRDIARKDQDAPRSGEGDASRELICGRRGLVDDLRREEPLADGQFGREMLPAEGGSANERVSPSPFPLVGHYFSAGMSIRYGDSLVVGSALSRQHLAPKLPVGER